MNRLKQLIFANGLEAYVSSFAALIAAILMLSVTLGLLINLKVGDHFNLSWLLFLNGLVNWNFLFISAAIFFGIAAAIFTMGSWKKVAIVVALLSIVIFCGIMAVVWGMGDTYTYAVAASTQHTDSIYRVIHAYRNGDVVNGADYVLAQCDLNGINCQVINRFDDYHYGTTTSKPVSFFVDASDHELYLKVGDETKLISKT